jgi:hypothetical protein
MDYDDADDAGSPLMHGAAAASATDGHAKILSRVGANHRLLRTIWDCERALIGLGVTTLALLIASGIWMLVWEKQQITNTQETLAYMRNESRAAQPSGYYAVGQLVSDALVATCDTSYVNLDFQAVQAGIIGRSTDDIVAWQAAAALFFLEEFGIDTSNETLRDCCIDAGVYVYDLRALLRTVFFSGRLIGPSGWQTIEAGEFVTVTQAGGLTVSGGAYNAGAATTLPQGTRIVYGDYVVLPPGNAPPGESAFIVGYSTAVPEFPPLHPWQYTNVDQAVVWNEHAGVAHGVRWVVNATLDGCAAYLDTSLSLQFPIPLVP